MAYAMGWKPDLPDRRDFYFKAPRLMPIPNEADLRPQCSPVLDQGSLGSCTANAVAGAICFDQKKQGLPYCVPSRLFIYYDARALEHTISIDSGATLRDSCKVLRQYGYPSEQLWPYDVNQFSTRPPAACYQAAQPNVNILYQRLPQFQMQMQLALASGLPFVAGISVYESFMSDTVARTGVVPLPGPDEKMLGGHAVLIVGFRQSSNVWIAKNSWSDQWGDHGYFTLPLSYLTDTDLSSDFWAITHIVS